MLNNIRVTDARISVLSERLSSGLRINRGADDPSGLAIAKGMKAQSSGYLAAIQNVQDGISLLDSMDGVLAEIQSMLNRIRDLAVRGSNEAVLTNCGDRKRLNNEARGLISEVDRTAKSVMFNGKKILSGDYLEDIVGTAGTQVIIESAATNPSQPGWLDTNTVTFTAEVSDTGNQTGARPSSLGGTTNREFQSVIDASNNPTTHTQTTMDPSTLTDADNDDFYGAGTNDPNDADAKYPVHESAPVAADDPDADNDGWHATVDNNDADNTETGTALLTLNADRTLPIASTTLSQNTAAVTWQNAVTRTFTAGYVDQADIVSTSGNTYTVQVYDVGTNAWTSVAAGLSGNQTVNFAEVNGNSIRVVYDDPVVQLAGVTNITGIRNKDVSLGGAVVASPPDTYHYSFGAATQIDTLTMDGSAGNYTVYKKVAGVISAVGAGVSGAPTVFAPGAGVTDIWVDFSTAGATVTQFDAAQSVAVGAPALSGTDGIQDFYLVNVPGGPKTISDLDVTLSNAASPYDIYFNGNVPPGVPDDAGVGSGPHSFPAAQNLTQFYIAVPTGESVTAVTASNVMAAPGSVQEQRYADYALTTPGQTITSIDVEATAGTQFQLFTNTGAAIGGVQTGLGAGSPITINAGSINPNSIQVRFSLGYGEATDLLSISPSATYALGAAANGFGDVDPPQDTNVAVYRINSAAIGDRTFDQITVNVMNGHPFSLEYSDNGVAWNAIASMTNINGTGAAVTYNFTDTLVDTSGNGDAYFRLTLHSGEKIGTAVLAQPIFVNRIDRDGDGFPDVIETKGGSNPDLQSSMPYGATASTAGSPELAPDDDGDGYLDAPAMYDTMDNQPAALASTNPFGMQYSDGSGNILNSTGPGAQYPNAGDTLKIDQIPSFADTDGDTFNDPLDPFPNTPEWQTWDDGASAAGGGALVFVSNRGTPNDPAAATKALYMGSMANGAGEYTNYTLLAGSTGADKPAFSIDGTALAWEDSTGGITASFITTSCQGNVNNVVQEVASGKNPTWSPDNTQIAFDDGGKIYINDVDASGAGAIYDYNISGSDPTWSPDGDTLLYTRGGQLYAYNFVTTIEYDLQIAGTAPSYSPDGTRIAFMTPGGDVAVQSLTLTKTPQVLQVGADNNTNEQISVSLPDARASKIGISSLSLLSQSSAVSAIDLADSAIDTISDYRSDIGTAANRLRYIVSDLSSQRINIEAARSRIEDADMSAEYTELVRAKILGSSSQAMLLHSMDALRMSVLGLIQNTLG